MFEGERAPKDHDSKVYEQFYYLTPEEREFFMAQTGINNEEELKRHIVSVQQDALKVAPYTCIKIFAFTKLVLASRPGYEHVLKLGKERKGAILLDIGCCFGVDLRKAVADGFPVENVLGSDLHPEYWDLGHKLFKTTAKEFPAHFIAGDAFDPTFFETAPPLDSPPTTPAPALSSLQTLTPLHGHIAAIHASSFFHLFDEAKQFELAKKLAGLLSPEPGSIILGGHAGQPVKGLWERRTLAGGHMFCHSPESWRELWDGQVFEKGKVRVDVVLKSVNELVKAEDMKKWINNAQKSEALNTENYQVLIWSVTRL